MAPVETRSTNARLKKRLAVICTVIGLSPLAALTGAPAEAQSPAAAPQLQCGPRNNMITALGHKYGEQPIGMGLASNGAMVELLSDKKKNSWTIIMTMPNGISCLMLAGESWERLPQLIAGRAS